MTRSARSRRTAAYAVAAAALALAVLTGCASHGGPGATSGSTSPQPSASGFAHMKKLVDDADSAAAVADSDAAHDN